MGWGIHNPDQSILNFSFKSLSLLHQLWWASTYETFGQIIKDRTEQTPLTDIRYMPLNLCLLPNPIYPKRWTKTWKKRQTVQFNQNIASIARIYLVVDK